MEQTERTEPESEEGREHQHRPSVGDGDESSDSDADDYRVVHVSKHDEFRFYDYEFNESKILDILEAIKSNRSKLIDLLPSEESSGDFLTMGTLSMDDFLGSSTSSAAQAKTKTFNIKEYQKTIFAPSKSLNKSKSNTIARFREVKPKWDGTNFPSKEVLDSLYRSPISDPTGRLITNLGRDEAKGVVPWNPPQVDRELPVPSIATCSETRKRNLLQHLHKVIERVEREYRTMKADTNKKQMIKALLGADLNNLKLERDRLVKDFASAESKHNKSSPMVTHK